MKRPDMLDEISTGYTITVEDHIARVEARKQELGITEERIEATRNSGQRRTPEKRALLRRIALRCAEANVIPFLCNIGEDDQ